MSVELSEAFFAKAAGWETIKQARQLVEQGKVLESAWSDPVLKGTLVEGASSLKTGLVIRDAINIENLCPCRQSRQWGQICHHAVAVGLHWVRAKQAPPSEPASSAKKPARLEEKTAPVLKGDPAGRPCRIRTVLPPNFIESIARGRITLHFEAEIDGQFMPMPSIPKGESLRFEPEDLPLVQWINSLQLAQVPAMVQTSPDEFAKFLSAAAGHPRIFIGRSRRFDVGPPTIVPLKAALMESGEIRIEASAPSGGRPLVLGSQTWWVGNESAFPLSIPAGWTKALAGPVVLPRSEVPRFLNQWPALEAAGVLEAPFDPGLVELVPDRPSIRIDLSGGMAILNARVTAQYAQPGWTPGMLWLPDPENPARYFFRDPAVEQEAEASLLRAGFVKQEREWVLRGQDSILKFFGSEYPRWQRIWKVEFDERLAASTAKHFERVEPVFQVASGGNDWFGLRIDYRSASGESITPSEVQRLLRGGQGTVRLKNGRIALVDPEALDEFNEVLRESSPVQEGGTYRLARAQEAWIESTVSRMPGWKWPGAPATKAPVPSLGDFEKILRPYQRAGVERIWEWRQSGFAGILADEMGLGKTVQALAFLEAARRAGESKGPSLVVCPTSLVFNWKAESAKFAPGFKVLVLAGSSRQAQFSEIPASDLVITSYALIRRDAARYAAIGFDTVILDEAQHIKNRQSQNAQAVKSIRSRFRLVLTGTPMENSVLDLWSIFDFLMPGYLGSAADFRERYEIPLGRSKDAALQDRLSRRIRPFLIRRLKREVAPELPAKIEQVSWCELAPEQAKLYAEFLQGARQEMERAASEGGPARGRVVAFNALLRLRQICCDPRLLPLDGGKEGGPPGSGKWDLFGELLEEVIDGGHRVLVFSQFVSMLQLLRERLEAEKIPFCYLDGSTRDREPVVRKFQATPAIPVFLISLKAGGTGLNLTAADTVIHYDPWWNPAVENQATARAHRIGQNRIVTSYKLITRGTVEEKILQLQNKKRELVESMVESEEAFAASLSWDELRGLLA